MRQLIILAFTIFLYQNIFAQKKVAITIDDVPNTKIYSNNNFHSELLNKLDSLIIPVSIFVNENLIFKTEFITENYNLLNQWIEKDYTTLGNHSFSHLRYSDVGLDIFSIDVIKGECILHELSKKYNKKLKYFRFPYNDLGKDSLQQAQIKMYLSENNYIIAPFTIESSDWIFNFVYEYYLEQNNIEEADKVAKLYIDKTLEYFNYFDSIAQSQYGRTINQIYLCHDNSINADYIDIIVKKLQEKGYTIVSLNEVLKDDIYDQPDYYYGKWGFSWIYRWMNNKKERQVLMQQEPDIMEIYNIYKTLTTKNETNN